MVLQSGGGGTDLQAVIQFADGVLDLLDRIEYRRIDPKDLTDPVYRLRYEAYRRENFVSHNAQGMLVDEFDHLNNAYCFGVYLDGQLVSSIRFHHMTPENRMSPSYSVFGDVLDPYLNRGDTMIDPGRFTADHEASLAYPALHFLTLRIPTMAVIHFDVRYCLSSVRPEHAPFYRRVYSSVQWASERMYHGLRFPMVLYACEIPVMYAGMLRRYPVFRSTEDERLRLFCPSESGVARPSVRETLDAAGRATESV